MTSDIEMLRPLIWTDIPKAGLNKAILATPIERQKLAKLLDIEELIDFSAQLQISRWRGDGLKIKAEIRAEVVQNCVVSLIPVTSHLEEQTEWCFKPETRQKEKNKMSQEDMLIDPLSEDPADPLIDGKVDLGELVIEHLVLMIDPFVKSPTASFEQFYNDGQKTAAPEAEDVSPFAVLKHAAKNDNN